ncbi:MAG: hypothetical protein ACXVEF_42535 [Polyangiales bacterium]
MLSPGSAFLIAYLPAHRIAYTGQRGTLESAAKTVAALQPRAEAARAQLDDRAAYLEHVDTRLRELAAKAGVTLPALPPPSAAPGMAIWLRSLPEFVRPRLTTELLQAAWAAGETARAVAIDVMLAQYTAYLRCSAPNDFDLRTRSEQLAKLLASAAANLQRALAATKIPVVGNYSNELRTLVQSTGDLAPSTTAGYEKLSVLSERVLQCIECHAEQLDVESLSETSDARGRFIPGILESIRRWDVQTKELEKKAQPTVNLERFSKGARQVMASAQKLADDRRHVHLTATHVLTCLLALPPVKERVDAAGGDVAAALAAADSVFAAMATSSAQSHLGDPLIALVGGLQGSNDEVTLEDLLLACVTLPPRATLDDIDRNGLDTPDEAARRTVISAGRLEGLARR